VLNYSGDKVPKLFLKNWVWNELKTKLRLQTEVYLNNQVLNRIRAMHSLCIIMLPILQLIFINVGMVQNMPDLDGLTPEYICFAHIVH